MRRYRCSCSAGDNQLCANRVRNERRASLASLRGALATSPRVYGTRDVCFGTFAQLNAEVARPPLHCIYLSLLSMIRWPSADLTASGPADRSALLSIHCSPTRFEASFKLNFSLCTRLQLHIWCLPPIPYRRPTSTRGSSRQRKVMHLLPLLNWFKSLV